MLTSGDALRGWSSRLDRESKLSEHLDGAGLPALEITGGKALARGELISRTTGALLGALLPVLGVVVIAAFNAFYWLPIRGESPRPRPS
jgi:hypothetical protein